MALKMTVNLLKNTFKFYFATTTNEKTPFS